MGSSSITLELLGIPIALNVLISLIATVIVVSLLVWWMTRRLSVTDPPKSQLAFEYLVDFVGNIVRDQLGAATKSKYIGLSLALFLFILVANLLGLPFLIEHDHISYFKSPTAELAGTLALAVMMNIISHIFGMQAKGVGRYWKETYLVPTMPIKIIEELINLLTLAMRLFGNIFAGEILLALVASMGNSFGVATWVVGIPIQMVWQGFSIFIGAIQAYVFVTLSMVYLAEKVEIEEVEK
ncbi:F0F1 ATP synthase subunit A [Aerococcaceae bacterium DSM 111176]|nr:F0F1 ATP synthase subunit A [Aerococcaceae bacterium DSM 111176]